ncbi:MAG: MFS transporter [Actinomycetota bacterium]
MARKALWGPLRDRDVRLLVGAQAFSQVGDWLYNVALIVFVLERTGSPAWVAAAGVVRLVPYVLFGPIGGAIADRRPRRRTMITSDLIRSAVMFALAVLAARHGSAAVAVALAAVATTFSVAYGPCVNAAVPLMVDEDDLSIVNTLITTVTNLSYALGPAIGGVLLILGSPAAAFAVNAATFLVSAGLTMGIRASLGPERAEQAPEEEHAGRSGGLADGLRALTGSPLVLALVLAQIATNVLYGLESVLYALASTERLGLSLNGVAFLYTAVGVGGLAAAGVAHRYADRSQVALVLAVACIACGVPMAGLAAIHLPAVALPLLLMEGAAMIVVDVLVVTSLQRLLGPDLLGRAFGTLDAMIVAGILAGSLLGPLLVHFLSLAAALVIGGGIVIAAGIGVLANARRIDTSVEAYAESLRPRVAVLQRLRIFAGASRSALEQLAEAAREESVPAATVVIRQGDVPDDLFVVHEGTLEVTIAGPGGEGHVADLGPGDFFGEIGLLRGVPRTATVRSTSPCSLFRIPGAAFLDAVTEGSVRSRTLTRTAQSRLAALPEHPPEPG